MSRRSEKLRRIPSKLLGELVNEGIAEIYIITDENKLLSLSDGASVGESRVIGRGQQGKIYAVVVESEIDRQIEKRLCVLKSLGHGQHNGSAPFQLHASITATHNTTIDNNIIKLMDIVTNEGEQYALLPFCGLFLDQLVEKMPTIHTKNPILYETILLHIFGDLLTALKSMHEMGVVHGDVKAANIAFYLGHFCLIDLDCSLRINQEVTSISGTPSYMHPLCFVNRHFCADPKNDIYALGILLKLLLNDQRVLTAMKEAESSTLQDFAKEGTAKLTEAEMRIGRLQAPILLEKKLAEPGHRSTLSKLHCIAERMTSVLADHQPSMEELITCFGQLKSEFMERHVGLGTEEEQEMELMSFYDSLTSNDFLSAFNLDEMNLTNSHHSSHSSFTYRGSISSDEGSYSDGGFSRYDNRDIF